MADDNDKPDEPISKAPGVVVPADATGTPPPAAIPEAGEVAGADAEKAAMVEQAKSRVAAVKESLSEKAADIEKSAQVPGQSPAPTAAAPGAPKAPVKKKEEGPKPVDASDHKLVRKLKGHFNGGIGEASEFVGQISIRIEPARIVDVCNFLRDDPEAAFNYLSDLTCVH